MSIVFILILLTNVSIGAIISATSREVEFDSGCEDFEERTNETEASRLSAEAKGAETVFGNETGQLPVAGASKDREETSDHSFRWPL